MTIIPTSRLARMRLASQRLTPQASAADPVEAAGAVVGIQAQDIRAVGLSLRSRVPGLERAAVAEHPDLLRTWTVRGTVHLIPAADLPWLHALTGPRNRRYYDGLMSKRGNLELALSIRPHALAILAGEGPMTRASLLGRLAELGHPPLGPSSANIVMPWLAVTGAVVGLADGRFRAAEQPTAVDQDEALASLGRRYLAGYGPAGEQDLAKWSGLPLSIARRALDAAGPLERSGELYTLPGTLDDEPPPAPAVLMLAAYDTAMLGWRTREPLVASADDARILPGGGVVKAALMVGGRAAATWRVEGSGRRRRLLLEHFGRAAPAAPLRAEMADVARFLGIDLDLET